MADRAGAVMFKGNPITLGGPEIKAGGDAPDFIAVDNGLQPVKLSQAKGKVIVLSAVRSTRRSATPRRAGSTWRRASSAPTWKCGR